jgi:hypothetical protein
MDGYIDEFYPEPVKISHQFVAARLARESLQFGDVSPQRAAATSDYSSATALSQWLTFLLISIQMEAPKNGQDRAERP